MQMPLEAEQPFEQRLFLVKFIVEPLAADSLKHREVLPQETRCAIHFKNRRMSPRQRRDALHNIRMAKVKPIKRPLRGIFRQIVHVRRRHDREERLTRFHFPAASALLHYTAARQRRLKSDARMFAAFPALQTIETILRWHGAGLTARGHHSLRHVAETNILPGGEGVLESGFDRTKGRAHKSTICR